MQKSEFTNVFRDVKPLREYRRTLLREGREVGLVPTMGALHQGHLSLIRQAAAENSDIFVTIYVNPTQFGVNEDLSSYPRTWDSDMQQLEQLDRQLQSTANSGRISAVFAPTTQAMYPTIPPSSELDGPGSFVLIKPVGDILEGASRPVFFRGVATVCMKLFNIIQPERAYFGQKDIQQTIVLRRMVQDFHLPLEMKIGPTVREPDGLAMSSRNIYLGARRRAAATMLWRALKKSESRYEDGERVRQKILSVAHGILEDVRTTQNELPASKRISFRLDYFSLADPDSLEELDEVDGERGAVLSGALKMLPLEASEIGEDCGLGEGTGSVRLIDNIILLPRSHP